jgi:hypothetical protein
MEIETVLADENYLGRVFDYGVIARRLQPWAPCSAARR